ncbi:MAG: endonuclease MutS2 [Calditrichaeota bacterium]|nr:endonuclease MutS2 [Calditrichota bacterium]
MLPDKVRTLLEYDKVLNHLGALSTCELGRERIQGLRPFATRDQAQRALSLVSEVRDLIETDASLPLAGLQDIRGQLRKAAVAGSMLSVEECVRVLRTLEVIRRLCDFRKARVGRYPLLGELLAGLADYRQIETELLRCIDPQTGYIRDAASPELARLRREIVRQQERARQLLEQVMRRVAAQGALQEQGSTLRDGRLVLVVREELRSKVKGFVHGRSASGASLFIEPIETFEVNNLVRELRLQEAEEEEKILRRLTTLVGSRAEDLLRDMDTLAELDFVNAKALFSQRLQANQPALNEHGLVRIQQGRHPLLVLKQGHQEVVPLDLTLGEQFTTLVISGPNAGGKTVALKTDGLLTHMAQSGLHVPASPDSDFALFSSFFADIGDEQSIEQDLSTFSSHVANIRAIIEEAGPSSLVLIDEIGAGTDPEEGVALAMSVLELLTRRGCRTVVTTHHGALKAFAFRTPGVANGSMEFDPETLRPTYRFRAGIPGSSYAFQIAHRLGLPAEVLERARELVGPQKNTVEGLIAELEEKLLRYRRLLAEVEAKDRELTALLSDYRQRSAELARQTRALQKEAAERAEQVLRRANAAVEQAIREIREQQASREAIHAAKHIIAEQRAQVEELAKQAAEPLPEPPSPVETAPGPIRKGDTVLWNRYGTTGVVASEADDSGKVLLRAGSVSTWVHLDELTKVTGKPGRRKGGVTYQVTSPATVGDEIDLRGLSSEEAIDQLSKFLDSAALTGLHSVRVIHGKGTGTLRKNVGEYLRSHPLIKETRLGAWNEGGSGVTIAELRTE